MSGMENPRSIHAPVWRPGQMVMYTVTEQQAKEINDAREERIADAQSNMRSLGRSGNRVEKGERFPMIIVKVWGNGIRSAVNGQLFLDGNDSWWVTSCSCGKGEGKFLES